MIFASLGELCHSSFLLKRNNLKKESYPFDWIFSSANMVKHCIEDDFKMFLNKDLYIDYNQNKRLKENQSGHIFYNQLIDSEIIFNHHNPLNESDYQYLERCVLRLKSMLQKEEKKIFLHFHKRRVSDEDVISSAIDLSNFMGKYTNNYEVLFINSYVDECRGHTISREKNLYFLDLKTNEETLGQWFDNEEDNVYLDEILKEILVDINKQ